MNLSATDIVNQYSAQVLSLVARIVDNRSDAEEITQDVFMKVFDSLHKFRGDSSLSTWIYRIAYNAAISQCRKRRIHNVELCPKQDSYDQDSYDQSREAQYLLLEEALKGLTPSDSMLIHLYYWKKLSVAELSQISSESQSNVKVRLHRIRHKLQKALSENGNDQQQ